MNASNIKESRLSSWLAPTLTAACLISLTAAAAAGHRGGERLFNKLDANDDGVVTREEEAAMAARRFQKLDADGDGSITAEELKSKHRCKKRSWWQQGKRRKCHHGHGGKRHGRLIERLDANGDGMLSAEEFAVKGAQMFERADVDGNGRVTREEMRAAHVTLRRERCQESAGRRFDALDADGDGLLSREEYLGRCVKRTTEADSEASER